MRILISETKDQKKRDFLDISKPELVFALEKDNGWHEVIDMFDSENEVRLYFDIDSYKILDPLIVKNETLTVLNRVFLTNNADWAICSANTSEKVSYHIMSRKYKCSLKILRKIVHDLNIEWIDKSVYWYDRNERMDQGYMRFPNQSKTSINKIGAPLTIEQGSISDFFITDTENLTLFPP